MHDPMAATSLCKVLLIRHLPPTLTFKEKEDMLIHFGATTVWENKKKRDYIFAAFPTAEQASDTLSRLHQLKIANRRLIVEYADETEQVHLPKLCDEQTNVPENIKNFIARLNAWNPSVDFYQPPPPHLKYKYPEATKTVLINIMKTIIEHRPFYTQTLHLMNKMCLDNPFKENYEAEVMFKNIFKDLFLDKLSIPMPGSEEEESEISSGEEDKNVHNVSKPIIKRKHILPNTKKRPAAVLLTAKIPLAKKRKDKVTEQVFEEVPAVEPKKISVNVAQDALEKQSEPAEVAGEIGKFQKEDKPEDSMEDTITEADKPTITKKELLQNRISYRDMKVLPIFKNYHPGPPSMRLYIKNLAKTVTEQDVKSIYKRYVEGLSEIEQIGFDVRVMQEGRMKGQGFVTFPSIAIAETALNETNGYILKDKPMVVQFARVANKKPID